MNIKATNYIMFLAVISVAFGVNYTSNLTNGTFATPLNYSDCVNVSYDGFGYLMVCAPAAPAPPSTVSFIKTLGYGEEYQNSSSYCAVNITAPHFPSLNINRTTSDAPYVNDTITFTCNAVKLNINKTLNFNSEKSYNNALYNITVNAPAFPAINLVKNLTYGSFPPDYYQSADDYNLTVRCTTILPTYLCINTNGLNVDRNISPSEIYFDRVCNVTLRNPNTVSICDVNAPILAAQCNANLTAEKNSKAELQTQIAVANAMANASKRDLDACRNSSLSTTGMNCTTSAIVFCPDKVAPMCTDTEKLNGQFAGCISRITQEANVSVTGYTVENARLSNDLQQCRSGEQNQKDIQETQLAIIAGIIFIAGGAFLIAMWLKNKKIKEDG
jgi:hypothetical protein